jgi:glycosyltransferase involved in cell wall biosynthesis
MAVQPPRFSLVIPIYNEEENVSSLLDEIHEVLAPLGVFEVIAVNDGSSDASLERMRQWKAAHGAQWLRILDLDRNSGQSAAVMAGVDGARSQLVLTMDGDMQNDPRDFLAMLEILERGEYQGVTGIRAARKDSFLRRASSRIGNRVRDLITGDRVSDAGCGIKGFQTEVFQSVPRFNGMHRFMATLARFAGARVAEIPVNHRPRAGGKAKYGIGNRAFRGLRDCMAVRWMRKRMLRHSVEEEW